MGHGGKVLKRLRIAGSAVVVSALFLGSLHAGRRSPRKIRIGEIKPLMSFSRVCVQGRVASGIRMLDDGTGLCILADETGSLPLFIDRVSGVEDLPAGSCIAATGRLGLNAGNRTCLRVPDTGRIEVLEEAEPTLVRGRVIERTTPAPGSRAPCRLLLERPEGRIEVVHWFPPQLEIGAGDRIEAKGTLGFYRDRMQVTVRDAADLRFQPEE